jgi:hypothetical protein
VLIFAATLYPIFREVFPKVMIDAPHMPRALLPATSASDPQFRRPFDRGVGFHSMLISVMNSPVI